jgi:hypothetical protein
VAEDDEAQATAEEAQDTADEASAVADPDALPSGLDGAPPAEALPATVPAAPVGSAVTPPPGAPANPEEARQQAFSAAGEGIAAATDKAGQVQAESDVDQDRLAAQKQDLDDENVRRQMDDLAQSDARAEYLAKKQAADEKVRDFKFHDYYDDPKHGSRVIGGFAAFLGGLGNLGGQNPGAQNQVLESIEHNMSRDHENQVAYLNSAKYFADKQGEGVQDLLKQQQSDRHEAELNFANKKLATADKFAELAQTARGKQNYDAAMIEVAKLKKSAYDDQQKVFGEIAAQKLEDAKAQHQLALANRHKSVGGAGGGGSGNAAMTAVAKEIEALQATLPEGQTVSEGQMGEIADKHHLPHTAKAGRPSLAALQVGLQKNASIGSSTVRTQERLNQLKLTGPNGEDLGMAHNLNDAKAASKSQAGFQQLQQRMKELIGDVETNGNRVLTPDDVQRRNSLGAKVLAAARVYNGLGATDASQHLESLINGALGTPGQGFFIGANLGVLKDNLAEADASNKARMAIYVRGGFPNKVEGKPDAGPELSPQQKKMLDAIKGQGYTAVNP